MTLEKTNLPEEKHLHSADPEVGPWRGGMGRRSLRKNVRFPGHQVDLEVGLWMVLVNSKMKEAEADPPHPNKINQKKGGKSIVILLTGPEVLLQHILNLRETDQQVVNNQNHLILLGEGDKDHPGKEKTALCHHTGEEGIQVHQNAAKCLPMKKKLATEKVHYHHTNLIRRKEESLRRENLRNPKVNHQIKT
jgi:hypothetical protein